MTVLAAQSGDERDQADKVFNAMNNHYQPVFKDMKATGKSKFELTSLGSKSKPKVVTVNGPRYIGTSSIELAKRLSGGHGAFDVRGHETTWKEMSKQMAGWREWVFHFGSGVRKLEARNAKGGEYCGWGAIIPGIKEYPQPDAAKAMAIRSLRTGKDITEKSHENWYWAARRIKIDRKACIKCHVGSKIGDPAGVLVFAIHSDKSRK